MFAIIRFYFALSFLFFALPAIAQEAKPDPLLSDNTLNIVQKKYGIAMHGEPKYSQGDTHIDYANPDAPKGGHLKQAAIGTFDTLNPYSIKGKAAQGLNLVYDRLMARVWDEPFSMYPLIAESYEMPENRSEITFHINPAARFHDGSAITADDVLYSFKTLKNEGRPNMRAV
jgi:ABC-type oligopeptide transport system substrate-binding subunit